MKKGKGDGGMFGGGLPPLSGPGTMLPPDDPHLPTKLEKQGHNQNIITPLLDFRF